MARLRDREFELSWSPPRLPAIPPARSVSIAMPGPSVWLEEIMHAPSIRALTSTAVVASFWVRENASNCAVNFEPRSAALKGVIGVTGDGADRSSASGSGRDCRPQPSADC